MRFGKRRDKETPEDDAAVGAPPVPDQATEDWLAPGDAADGQADHSMPPPEPEPLVATETEAVASDPQAEAEPEGDAVVEGEAVELPYEPPVAAQPFTEPAPADEALAYEVPAPHPIEREPAAPLAGSTPQHAPGVGPSSGGAWPEPAFDPAERPEILVGAAFGGGLLLALILRRFGN